jgi:hypothetical protein
MGTDNRQKFIDSLLNNDFETALALIHPACVIRHPPGLPYGGVVFGPAGFQGILEALTSAFDLEVEKVETLVADDYLVVRFWAKFIHKQSGKFAEMTTAEFYRFEDGLVVEQDNYYKSPEKITEMMTELPA